MSVKESNIEYEARNRWPLHVENFTWFLIQCRRYFNGDLDRLLVFYVISARSLLTKSMLEDRTIENLGLDHSHQEAIRPANLQTIADCSGLPRETARRKLQDLTVLGWVNRDERGNFSTTKKAIADLAALREMEIEYLARMKNIVAP